MEPATTPAPCRHQELAVGARCPGCGRLQGYLAAKGLTRPAPPAPPAAERRLARAWASHPAVALLTHRRRLAFLRQLHALLKSGSGLPTALAELARYAPDAHTREVVARAATRLEAGAGLAEALRDDQGPLDGAALELVAAAEETGKLEPMLARSIAQAEAAQGLRWKAVLAALYPGYLLLGLVLFGPLLELPSAITAAGGATCGLGSTYLHGLLRNLFVSSLALGGLFSFPLLVAALGLETPWDRLKSGLPVLGRVYLAGYRARFANAFGSAVGAGLGAERCLELACRATQSPALGARAPLALEAVRRGGTFAEGLAALGLFEPTDLGQLAVGERTGELEAACARLADEHWEAAVRGVRVATFVAAGLVVGALLLSILAKLLGVILGPVSSYYNFQIRE